MRNWRQNPNLKNSAWSLLDVLIYPVLFLYFTPYFIDRLSPEGFGIWMFFQTVILSFNFLSVGLHEAAVYILAKAAGREQGRFIGSFMGSMLVVGCCFWLFVALLLLIGQMIGWQVLFPGINFGGIPLPLLMIWCSGILLVKFLLQVFFALFKAFERFDYSSGSNTFIRLTGLGGILLILNRNGGVADIFGVQFAVHLMGLVLAGTIGFRMAPPLIQLGETGRHFRMMVGYGKWFWSQGLISMFSLQADRYLVAYFAGAATLGYYSVIATLFNHLHMAFDALAGWVFPKISKWKEQKLPVVALYQSVQTVVLAFGLTALAVFYFSYPSLLSLWLGDVKYLEVKLFVPFFILYETFYLHTVVNKFYLNAINRMRFNTLLEYFYKLLIIAAFSIVFFITRDILDMLLAMALSTAAAVSIYVYLIKRTTAIGRAGIATLIDLLPSVLLFAAIFVQQFIFSIFLTVLAVSSLGIHLKKYLDIEVLRR